MIGGAARRACAALAALGFALAALPAWPLEARRDLLGPFFNESDGMSQQSSSPYTADIRTDGILRIVYRAPRTHCSPIRIWVAVDDGAPWVTAPIAPGQESESLDLGLQSAGVHALVLNAEGKPGGCNSGRLLSWGGTLSVWTSGPDSGPVTRAGPLGDVVFEIERIAFERGFSYRGEYISSDGTVHRYGTDRPRPLLRPPSADDGWYGVDWLRAKYGREGTMSASVADDTLRHMHALARALAGRGGSRRAPNYQSASTSVTAYVLDGAHGGYLRIPLAERGERLWSSPPPVHWDEGSKEAAELTAWLLGLNLQSGAP